MEGIFFLLHGAGRGGGVLTVRREGIGFSSLLFPITQCKKCPIAAPKLLMHTSFYFHSLSYIRYFMDESSKTPATFYTG